MLVGVCDVDFTRLNIRHNIRAILTEYIGRDFVFCESWRFFFLPQATTSGETLLHSWDGMKAGGLKTVSVTAVAGRI